MTSQEQPGGRAGRRASYLILAAFALGIAAIAGTTLALLPKGPSAPPASAVGGPFRLQSSKGGVLDSASLAGRPFLVFFGFTQCPNICPTTLADLGNLLDELGKEGVALPALYVTVDPERDTAETMRAYMGSFSERLTGLTGTPDEIARVAASYRAMVRRVELPDGDHTFEHTVMVYMMDRRGGFAGPLDLDAGHRLAGGQIRTLLARN